VFAILGAVFAGIQVVVSATGAKAVYDHYSLRDDMVMSTNSGINVLTAVELRGARGVLAS